MLPLDFRDLSIEMGPQEGDEPGICSRDAGISGCNGKEISDVLCLLRSSSSGNAGVLSVVIRLDWRAWIIGGGLSGTQKLRAKVDYTCVMIVSA